MLSPWIFPSHGDDSVRFARVVSDSIAGAIILGSAAMALQDLQPRAEWINFFAGIWLIASPWLLGFAHEPGPLWSATISGALVWTVSVLALPIARERWSREHPHGV
jgi:hypothetical protein